MCTLLDDTRDILCIFVLNYLGYLHCTGKRLATFYFCYILSTFYAIN